MVTVMTPSRSSPGSGTDIASMIPRPLARAEKDYGERGGASRESAKSESRQNAPSASAEAEGQALCPYCGYRYVLKGGARKSGH